MKNTKKYNMNKSFLQVKCMASILAFFFLFSTGMKAQDEVSPNQGKGQVITGTVRDAHTREPIPAAQVEILNKTSAVCDENGQFKITVQSGDEVLHVTAYDYNKMEVAVQGRENVIINLYPIGFSNYFKDISNPAGDLVNQSSLAVSAKSKENISDITDITIDGTIQSVLGGDVRSITRSGLAGIGNSMFIRGINSLNANAQPLFVIDGVVWSGSYDIESIHKGYYYNPLENIDVNDIETVTVLKDGTSIYGAKAANGVVLINTRRAKSMVTKIALNVFYGMSETPKATPMMSGDQFRVYASDLMKTYPESSPSISSSFLGSPLGGNNKKYYNNTDWADEVYQTGSTGNYLVNVDGGDERAMYYFSIGYTGNEGVVKTTDLQRLNARFNVDTKLAKILTMGVNLGFTRIERTLLDDGTDYYSSPTWQSQIKSPFFSMFNYTDNGGISKRLADADDFGVANPVGVIDWSKNKSTRYRFNFSVVPKLTIIPGLVLSTQFDYNLENAEEAYFLPMGYTSSRYIAQDKLSENQLKAQTLKNSMIYDDTRLSYTKMFGDHSLQAMIGVRYIHNYFETDYIEEHNSGANTNTMITGKYKFLTIDGLNNLSKNLTDYANVEYNYRKKYFLSASMALDASSRFGDNTDGGLQMFGVSWGVFPSVNAAWLFSSEKFMEAVPAINFGKIRVGYGITGNDAIPDYEAQAYFTSTSFSDRANGLIISHMENDKLQWEETKRVNAGIDLGLFNDRLDLSFDLFSSKTDHLLVQKNNPELIGPGMYWTNDGAMENKGYELSVNSKILNERNFKWELGFSVGHYKNKVTSLLEGEDYFLTEVYGGEVITQVGQPAGLFYGYNTKGVLSTKQAADEAHLKIPTLTGVDQYFSAGDILYEDYYQDGIIDAKDKQIIGDPNPDIYGTISSKWMFKQFTLNALFTYSYGNDVYNYYRQLLESGSDFINQTTVMANRWVAEGQLTNQPKATYGDPMGNSRFSDRWIEDGSFLRLKTLTLSYQLPLKNNYIKEINFWASGGNLFTITNYLGKDPEFSARNSVFYQGIDAGLIPQTRTYTLGIRIDL